MSHVEYLPGSRLKGFAKRRFENGILQKIKRWNGEVAPDGYRETVRDHVFGLFTTIDALSNPLEYPYFSQAFNPKRAKDLAYVHDAGEIRAGDLWRSHPNYEQLKPEWDRLDHEYFHNIIAAHLPHTTIAGKILNTFYPPSRRYATEVTRLARESYTAAEDISLSDKEALLLRILDRFQAAEVGFVHFQDSLLVQRMAPEDRVKVIRNTLKATAPHVSNLLKLLSPDAQKDFGKYLSSVGNMYRQYGYEDLFVSEISYMNNTSTVE